ncbi:MAG: CapA family protein [Clostridiales bacterium]|nr:CapA family protein [Clostridiales bacterium]
MKAFFKGLGIGLAIGIPILLALILYFKITAQKLPDGPSADSLTTQETLPDRPLPEEESVSETEEQPETPPLTDDTDLPSRPEEPRSATLAFAGDVQFPDHYLNAYDRSGISAIADAGMLEEMQSADLFLLNEEFPFSLRGEPMPDKQFTFRTDPKYVKILQDLGTDMVTVGNNHALDFGQDAFLDTLDTLQQADIACIGGGRNISEASAPAVRTIGDQTFAFFGATRVSPSYDWYATDSQPGLFQTYDPAKLNAAIAQAEEAYDHTIVFVHWGIEKSETPEEYQRVLAKGYIDAGADLVVGCHPHVLQGFEYYKGVPVIYSLGNYLFGSRGGETLLLKAIFSPGEPLTIQLVPCQRQDGVLSRIQESSALYQRLRDLSFHADISEDGILRAQENIPPES